MHFMHNKFESVKTQMNCDKSLTLKMDAEFVVPPKYFEKKSKRYRSAFTTEQIHALEREFKKFPYIGSANRKEVANILKISERAVKIWFQNRRMKEKREINNNKELLDEDKNNIVNATSNNQLNSCNGYLDSNCGANELLLSYPYQKEHLTQSNMETRNSNCTSNERSNFTNQIQIKSVRNINTVDYKPKTITMDVTKDIRKSIKLKPITTHEVNNNLRKNSTVTQRSKHEKTFDIVNKEFKRENISTPIKNINKYEVAQDLSLNNVITDQKEYKQFYPVQSDADQRLVPLFTQGYYVSQPISAPEVIHSGNVFWKPVSVMPILPGLAPASVAIDHNSPGISLNNQDAVKGTCNCHGPPHLFNARLQCVSRTQPQYVLAIPFSNSTSKF